MNRAIVAGVSVGDGLDVAVVGALNVSPESFYSGSVVVDADRLLQAGEAMARAGAAWLDVGAMSTAPYLEARIPEALEADRLHWAVGLLTTKLDLPVSADVSRVGPARAALEAGARIINDVTGLAGDPALARLTAEAGAALVLMAGPAASPAAGEPMAMVRAALERGLAIARGAGLPDERILVDPGIGFFRGAGVAWPDWDCRVLAGLPALRGLGRPLHVGVSRKSFIGAVAGVGDPAERLPGSLAAAAAAVLGGAHVIRAHDVAETVQAVRVAQAIRGAGRFR
ncbi:MAG TPA: dihydropteroate synthase [Candidatus Limnocylindria bacterium]|nr:dihydropteroate synthase [Candidatus Limnocylindria bacterium]